MYASGLGGRVGGKKIILRFRRLVLTDGVQGEKGVQAASVPSAVCLICTPAGRKGDRTGHVFLLHFRRSILAGWMCRRESGAGVSLLSAAALLVCLPANREGGPAGHIFVSRSWRSMFPERGSVGEVFGHSLPSE